MTPSGGEDLSSLFFYQRKVLTALSGVWLAGGRRFPGALESEFQVT